MATLTLMLAMLVACAAQPDDPPSYAESFQVLHAELGARYPCFALKGIDWDDVGRELIPRAETVEDDETFGFLCLELVARLEDSHARLLPATCAVPTVPWPRFHTGFACLIDDAGAPVVFHVTPESPAARAGISPGMVLLSIDGVPAEERLRRRMIEFGRFFGYSSARCLRHDASRALGATMERGETVRVRFRHAREGGDDGDAEFTLPARVERGGLPRQPVPIPGLDSRGNVAWTRLEHDLGYIAVRRIRDDLVPRLDAAVADLRDARGLIIDVRGNGGGGFDGRRAHANFTAQRAPGDADRPAFRGPIAVLIDARCISAGEGWTSWFVARRRALLFGETTAGASARKTEYTLPCGRYRVRFPIRPYRGALDRWIERRGIEPDVPLMPRAVDLAAGSDTILEAAMRYLDDGTLPAP